MSTSDDAIVISNDSDDDDTPAQQQHMQGPNSQRATSATAARCVVDLTMDSDDEPTARRNGDAEPAAPRAPPPRPPQRLNPAPPPRARQAPKPKAPKKRRAPDSSAPQKRHKKKFKTKRVKGGRGAFPCNPELIVQKSPWDYRKKKQHDDIALPSTPPPPEPDLRWLPTDPAAVAACLKKNGLPNATLSWTNDAEALVLLRSVLRAEGFRAWRVAEQVAAGRRHRFLKRERAIDTECAWCLQEPARHGPSGTCSDGCFHALALSTGSSSDTSVYMRQCVLARAADSNGVVRCECDKSRCRKELYRPGCGTFYCEVDHRRRVDCGGGCCGLDNLRPMNPQCHRDKEPAARRKKRG